MSVFWSEFLSTHSITGSQPPSQAPATLYPITDRQVINIEGADSKKFMQGQFTCHMDEITPSQFRRGACCTAKGRMISSFNLAQRTEQNYLMSLHGSLAESTLQHLKKYMVFFKATMQASNMILAGIKGPDAHSILQTVLGQCPQDDYQQAVCDFGLIIKLPFDAGFELFIEEGQAKQVLESLISECQLTQEDAWPLNLIEHGLAQLTSTSVEKFIPQMLNLGQTGGISFSKGCYTGQEIVARMEYLGKLKRHLYLANINNTADNQTAINTGDSIFREGSISPAGEIVNISNHSNGQSALVVLEDKYLQNPLFVNSVNGPQIELLSLPYEIVKQA